jgi:predicted transcriptional regulator
MEKKITLMPNGGDQRVMNNMLKRKLEDRLKTQIIELIRRDYSMISGDKVQQMFAEDLIRLIDSNLKEPWRMDVGQVLWLAADLNERPRYGKNAKDIKLIPVSLTLVNNEDLLARSNGFTEREVREMKIVRLFKEAYLQGGLLSNNDVALLLGVSPTTVSLQVREYMNREGKVVPTRGIVHDIGRAITHKKVVIKHYLNGLYTPEIAKQVKHSEEACERYIRAFNKIRMLYERGVDLYTIAKTLEMSPYRERSKSWE